MDHIAILKRAWTITWQYRALWLFGFLLALLGGGNTGGGGGGSGGAPNIQYGGGRPSGAPFPRFLPEWHLDVGTVLALVGALGCFFLFLFIISLVVRYVAQTAIYRLVDELEETGERPTVGRGFRLGWDRRALRLFLIDLVIDVPFVLLALFLLLLALSPLLGFLVDNTSVRILSGVMTVGLVVVVILLLILVAAVLGLLKQFMHRRAALEGRGVAESIAEGYEMVRTNFQDVAIMWLVMLGVAIGWHIVTIPVVLVMLAVAGLSGGVPGFLIYQATRSLLAALLVGAPVFLFVLVVPLAFVGGLYVTYHTSVWTLAYREVRSRYEGRLVVEPTSP
ncbi:MAG TPA: hypothetical protein EYP04_03125 [Anaerolineae bacterium]|nr:hypothetical protein [Anaerolineae bacterium]HIQ05041.1 hypothetical protein [Anaerolineae bacterium]